MTVVDMPQLVREDGRELPAVQQYDQLVGHRRHRAGHAVIALDRHRIRIAPNLTAIRQGQAAERVLLLVAVVVHEVHAPAEDGGAGVTLAHVNGHGHCGLRQRQSLLLFFTEECPLRIVVRRPIRDLYEQEGEISLRACRRGPGDQTDP